MVLVQTIFGSSGNIFDDNFEWRVPDCNSCGDNEHGGLAASGYGFNLQVRIRITCSFKKQPSSDKLVRISRYAVLVIAIIAMLISLDQDSLCLHRCHGGGGFGAAFGPCILFSLYYRR